MSSHLRRLPLREAVQALKAGEGSDQLPSSVKAVVIRHVQKNSPAGPREFLKTIAPRLAYSNPSLSISTSPIRDPRSGEKSKDPKDPNKGAEWEGGQQPQPEMVLEFHNAPSQTVPLSSLSGSAILSELLARTGTNPKANTRTQTDSESAPASTPGRSSSIVEGIAAAAAAGLGA